MTNMLKIHRFNFIYGLPATSGYKAFAFPLFKNKQPKANDLHLLLWGRLTRFLLWILSRIKECNNNNSFTLYPVIDPCLSRKLKSS
jgi:hypothetical protein